LQGRERKDHPLGDVQSAEDLWAAGFDKFRATKQDS